MEHPRLFVITGIMAAGKSSVAEVLARRFDRGVHLRGDGFRRSIVSGRVEMSPAASPEALSQLRLRHRLAAAAADQYVDAGFTVVLQDNFLGEYLAFVLDALSTRPVSVVVLCPSSDEVSRREGGREKVGYVGFTPLDLDEVLHTETPGIGLWLDSTGQTVEQTVDAILAGNSESAWPR